MMHQPPPRPAAPPRVAGAGRCTLAAATALLLLGSAAVTARAQPAPAAADPARRETPTFDARALIEAERERAQPAASLRAAAPVQPRIVGGEPARLVPWQVALVFNELPERRPAWVPASFFCGGSVVAPQWVLTAAHCVKDRQPNDLLVYSGSVHLNFGGQISEVERIVVHEGYSEETFDNDIALVRVSGTLRGTPIAPVTKGEEGGLIPTGRTVVVTGWGATEEGGPISTALFRVRVPVVDNATCNQSYGGAITDNMLCAGLAQGGKDSCQGDSGGPNVAQAPGGVFRQVGVVSFGNGCARPAGFGVYTRVANYADWIRTNMR